MNDTNILDSRVVAAYLQTAVRTHYDFPNLLLLAQQLLSPHSGRDQARFIGRVVCGIAVVLDGARAEHAAVGAPEFELDLSFAREEWADDESLTAGLNAASMAVHAASGDGDMQTVADIAYAVWASPDPESVVSFIVGLLEVLHRLDHATHAQLVFGVESEK